MFHFVFEMVNLSTILDLSSESNLGDNISNTSTKNVRLEEGRYSKFANWKTVILQGLLHDFECNIAKKKRGGKQAQRVLQCTNDKKSECTIYRL